VANAITLLLALMILGLKLRYGGKPAAPAARTPNGPAHGE